MASALSSTHIMHALPVEMMEEVFLQLPFRDLLAARTICKFWFAVIKKSPSLQRRLFLGPARATLAHPVLTERFPGPYLKSYPCFDHKTRKFGFETELQLSTSSERWLPTNRPDKSIKEALFGNPLPEVPYEFWSKMFLVQPPAKAVSVKYICTMFPEIHLEFRLEDEEGVKLGALFEAFKQYEGDWWSEMTWIEAKRKGNRLRSMAKLKSG